jgi:hypothetical protein
MINQIQPYTITRAARSCIDCDGNRKAFDLGGFCEPRAKGLPVNCELERTARGVR